MADKPYETRTVTADLALRELGDVPVLTGYASTFNHPYRVGHFQERIHPDAFKRTLAGNPDVRLLIDHEGQPLARTKSGTLQLTTDERGLAVNATLDPADPDVQRLLPKMRRGDLDQMSFAFRVPTGGDTWDYTGDVPDRVIREANLSGGDVSVVTYAANEATTASVRARDEREAAWTLADAMLREMRGGHDFDAPRLLLLEESLTILGYRANKTPYGDVDYADPGYQPDGKKRYPLDTVEHVRAGWAYVNQADNQKPYTAEQLANIKDRIKAAAKKFGIEISEANSARPLDLAMRNAQALALHAPRK